MLYQRLVRKHKRATKHLRRRREKDMAENPNTWGLWIGFDILVGIALAAPGLALGTAVHLFGMKQYHHFVRPAILSSLLGYIFALFALLFDLGRYSRLPSSA